MIITRRTILMYHRVAEDPMDPYSLCVAPDRFEAQLRMICQSADVVTLDQLGQKGSRPRVVLTFDDGYADNLSAALPIAEQFGAAITVYVTSGMVGDPAGFWWDRLASLLHGRDELDLDVEPGGRPLRIRLHGRQSAEKALVALHTRLRLLEPAEIEQCLAALAHQLGTGAPAPDRARVMIEEELRRLAASPLVTIGAHTTDHVLLAGRPLAAQIDTIARSKGDLERALGRPVGHFAYPFGDREAFNAASVEAARACGFRTACTTLGGRVTRLNDRLRLPRRMVKDWDTDELGRQLHTWGAI